MAYFEFPHTRTYDSDLGWIIRNMKQLVDEYGQLAAYEVMHKKEYKELYEQVQALAASLIDVIVPWDPGYEYSIYTIVEYEGTNYIALKDVPIGINITNTEYWTPANTIVEQINAIGASVGDLQREVKAMEGVRIGFPSFGHGYEGNSGLCTWARLENGNFVIFDFGLPDVFATIRDLLVEAGCTKIQAMILSHYHLDHRSEPLYWVSSPFDMSETVFYFPLATSTFEASATSLAEWQGAFPQNTFIFPDENSVYNVDTVTLRFNNCGPAALAYYEEHTPTDYNQFSMVTTLEYMGLRYLSTGDIGNSGMDYWRSLGTMQHVDVMTAPHHGTNPSMLQDNSSRILNPNYIWIPNNKESFNRYGDQEPMLAYCASLGARIASQFMEEEGYYQMAFTHAGMTEPGLNFLPYYAFNSLSYYANVYVDGSYTGEYQNGNQETPFSSLIGALDKAGGFPLNIHVSNLSMLGVNTYINTKENINIVFDPATCEFNYFFIISCRYVTIEGLKCATFRLNGCAGVTLKNVEVTNSSTQAQVSQSAGCIIDGINFTDAVNVPNYVMNIQRSYITITGTCRCYTAFNTAAINLIDSVVNTALGTNFLANTSNQGDVFNIQRSQTIGNTRGSSANLARLFTVQSGVLIGYDTTLSKPVSISQDGVIPLT